MIQSGRKRKIKHKALYEADAFPKSAKMTAVLGILVFTVFLCVSAGTDGNTSNVGNTFGEGAYPVFGPAEDTVQTPEDAFVEADQSIWGYLESVISRLIYGDR